MPELDQETTFPLGSEKVTLVLLKVANTWQIPEVMFLLPLALRTLTVSTPLLSKSSAVSPSSFFLPLDSDGRISDIDKYVVDLYNFAVFQHRINNGYIQSENSTEDDPCSFVLPENCNVGFDAHFAEIEWWDDTLSANAESDFLKLLGVMQASYNYRTSGLFDCYPSLYVAQGQVDLPDSWTNWTSITSQQRADTIDHYADRIYIYAYQRVPCDCYWGQSNATTNDGDENDWFNKANYYSSNTISTEIYPVFNAKFYDST